MSDVLMPIHIYVTLCILNHYEVPSILHLRNIVLYGYETWFPTLREEYRLKVFENRVLRRLFGSKGKEVVGD